MGATEVPTMIRGVVSWNVDFMDEDAAACGASWFICNPQSFKNRRLQHAHHVSSFRKFKMMHFISF